MKHEPAIDTLMKNAVAYVKDNTFREESEPQDTIVNVQKDEERPDSKDRKSSTQSSCNEENVCLENEELSNVQSHDQIVSEDIENTREGDSKTTKHSLRNRKCIIASIGIFLTTLLLVSTWAITDTPQNKYIKAQKLFAEGKIEKSISILEQLANNDDYTDAQKRLAYLYLQSDSVKLDVKKGVKYLKIAVQKNDSASYYNIMNLYLGNPYKGKTYKNNQQAKFYANLAVSKHICLDKAYFTLGNVACDDEDYELAFYYWSKSSSLGNSSADSNLGWMYYWGNGCMIDYNKAFNFMYRAYCKNENNDFALFYLGLMYQDGNGVSINKNKAKELLKRSADLGNEDAQKEYAKIEMNK